MAGQLRYPKKVLPEARGARKSAEASIGPCSHRWAGNVTYHFAAGYAAYHFILAGFVPILLGNPEMSSEEDENV